MTVPRSSPPRKRRASVASVVFTVTVTTTMIATGGFGALPGNPITTTFQEEIGQNLPDPFLDLFNSYLDDLSVPTIPPQPASTPNPSLDLIALLLGDTPTETPDALTPSPTETPTAAPSPTVTLTSAFTPTSTPTATSTYTPTSTPTPTPTRICSRPSTTPATTTFINGSGLTMEIYLVNPDCKLTLASALGPEQSIILETFIGQFWWFVDAASTRLVADYVVSSANETVDVSTGTIIAATVTPATPPTSVPFTGFTVSNVSLTDDVAQFGTSITLSPGQEFYVSYDFRVFNDPCPGCITQLVTGLGSPGAHAGTCAYNGVPGVSPGVTGFESVTLYAPEASGTYYVVVEYHWQFNCGDALSFYGTGGAVSPQFIGQITVR